VDQSLVTSQKKGNEGYYKAGEEMKRYMKVSFVWIGIAAQGGSIKSMDLGKMVEENNKEMSAEYDFLEKISLPSVVELKEMHSSKTFQEVEKSKKNEQQTEKDEDGEPEYLGDGFLGFTREMFE
jgi:hypothetical protein